MILDLKIKNTAAMIQSMARMVSRVIFSLSTKTEMGMNTVRAMASCMILS